MDETLSVFQSWQMLQDTDWVETSLDIFKMKCISDFKNFCSLLLMRLENKSITTQNGMLLTWFGWVF
jgi:hypothetical protein